MITLPDTLRLVKPCFHWPAFAEPILQKLPAFSRSSGKMVSTDPTDMPALAAICFTVKRRSSITVCSTPAIMSSDRLVCGRGSFGLFSHDVRPSLNCRTHERTHFIACLTQLLMNFDGFHATQVEESGNHALFFECKRRHFQYLKHYYHSTTSQAFSG